MIDTISDEMYDYFRFSQNKEIINVLLSLINGDNDLMEITIGLYMHLDETYKKQFLDEVLR